jgi:hypothetical protein
MLCLCLHELCPKLIHVEEKLLLERQTTLLVFIIHLRRRKLEYRAQDHASSTCNRHQLSSARSRSVLIPLGHLPSVFVRDFVVPLMLTHPASQLADRVGRLLFSRLKAV